MIPASSLRPLPSTLRTAHRSATLALGLALLLGGCSGRIPGVYRIDIQQGNVITQAQMAQLEAGMEKRKVRFVLGTPLVTDTFNQDRWDYYYSYEQGNGDRVQRIVSVYFDDERLVKVTGDVKRASGPLKIPPRQDEIVKVPEGLIDDGLLAALTPGFLSGRPRRIEPEPESSDQGTAQPASSTAATPAAPTDAPQVTLSEAETRELTAVLSGFGRRDPNPIDASGSAESGSAQEQGALSRFAERLGLKPPDSAAQDLSGSN